MFKKKYTIRYLFIDSKGTPKDQIERDDYRVPNSGEYIYFKCRGDRFCKVRNITTELTHSRSDVIYIVEVLFS